jgi:hypothetical protein
VSLVNLIAGLTLLVVAYAGLQLSLNEVKTEIGRPREAIPAVTPFTSPLCRKDVNGRCDLGNLTFGTPTPVRGLRAPQNLH